LPRPFVIPWEMTIPETVPAPMVVPKPKEECEDGSPPEFSRYCKEMGRRCRSGDNVIKWYKPGRGPLRGHDFCETCENMCMQAQGSWPSRVPASYGGGRCPDIDDSDLKNPSVLEQFKSWFRFPPPRRGCQGAECIAGSP
jgi:hypothetical protein